MIGHLIRNRKFGRIKKAISQPTSKLNYYGMSIPYNLWTYRAYSQNENIAKLVNNIKNLEQSEYIYLANHYLENDNPKESKKVMQSALKYRPVYETPELYRVLGTILHEQGDYVGAGIYYQRAQKLGINDALLLVNMIDIYKRENNVHKMIDTYESLIEIEPRPEHYISLANLLRSSDPEQSKVYLKQSQELDEDNILVRTEHAYHDLFVRQELPQEAVEELQTILETGLNNDTANLYIAIIFESLNDIDLVNHHLELIELENIDKTMQAEVYFLKAVIQHKGAEYKTAMKLYKKALNISNLGHWHSLHNLGLIYYEEKDFNMAKTIFKRVVAFRPEYTAGLISLGSLYHHTGDLEKSAMLFNEAIKIDPNDWQSHLNISNVYKELGHEVLSRRHMAIANSLSGDVQEICKAVNDEYGAKNEVEDEEEDEEDEGYMDPNFAQDLEKLNNMSDKDI
eukprot:TRINITY_DN11515_c0_g1_i1.p1 TRINITY_DN11515_c0_g1~~TRINITY_DN11515_c0_g1_i1.p1  ORF type:complete len:455 (-),score=100.80 TRINITY_DN11515_c0_g1_i1:18-1382(-)